MIIHSLGRLARKLEPVITVLYLIYFLVPALGPPEIDKVIKALSYPLVTILLLGQLKQWKRFLYVFMQDKVLLLLIGISIASFFWSADPSNTQTELRALIRTFVFAVYVVTRYSFTEQIQLWNWVFWLTIISSLVVGMRPINEAWTGIFLYKNHLAKIMTFASLLFITNYLKTEKWRWFALFGYALCASLTFLSQSKSSYVFFVVMMCIFPIYRFIKLHYKIRVIFILVTIIISGGAIALLLGNLELFLVDILQKDLTFNGRTTIWELMFDKFWQRPLTGYGFAGFWTSEEAFYIFQNSWARGSESFRFNSHNSFMELLLQLGVPGLCLYLLNYFLAVSRSVNLINVTLDVNKKMDYFWLIQTLIAMFLFNWSDSGGVLGNDSLWIFYMSISLTTIILSKRIKLQQHLTHAPSAAKQFYSS